MARTLASANMATVVACALIFASCKSKPVSPPVALTPVVAPVQTEVVKVVDHSMTPEEFVKAVANSDRFQIQLAKIVLSSTSPETVQDFALRMKANHTAIELLVVKLAAAQAIPLDTTLSAEDQSKIAELSALSGDALAEAYMALMAERNPKTLAMYRWQYDNCSNPEIKSFAMQTMPIIGTHARLAEQLNAIVNKESIRLAAELKAAQVKAAEEAKALAAATQLLEAQKASSKKSRSKKAATPPPDVSP